MANYMQSFVAPLNVSDGLVVNPANALIPSDGGASPFTTYNNPVRPIGTVGIVFSLLFSNTSNAEVNVSFRTVNSATQAYIYGGKKLPVPAGSTLYIDGKIVLNKGCWLEAFAEDGSQGAVNCTASVCAMDQE